MILLNYRVIFIFNEIEQTNVVCSKISDNKDDRNLGEIEIRVNSKNEMFFFDQVCKCGIFYI